MSSWWSVSMVEGFLIEGTFVYDMVEMEDVFRVQM